MKKLSAFLLLLGFFFSVFFIRASWGAGGSIVEYLPKGLSKVFMIGGGSEHHYVTTSFIGYVFLIVFGLMNAKRAKTAGLTKPLTVFLVVNIFCLLFELVGWLLMYNGSFHGIHIRIGAPLTLFGLWLWDRFYNVH